LEQLCGVGTLYSKGQKYDLLLRRNMSPLFYRRFIFSDTLISFWLVNNPIIVKHCILGISATMKSIYFLSFGIQCSYTTELFQVIAKKMCYLKYALKILFQLFPFKKIYALRQPKMVEGDHPDI
jgi:hypothetical protein